MEYSVLIGFKERVGHHIAQTVTYQNFIKFLINPNFWSLLWIRKSIIIRLAPNFIFKIKIEIWKQDFLYFPLYPSSHNYYTLVRFSTHYKSASPPKPPLHHTRHPFSVHNSHPNFAGLIRKPLKKITTNFTNVKVIWLLLLKNIRNVSSENIHSDIVDNVEIDITSNVLNKSPNKLKFFKN